MDALTQAFETPESRTPPGAVVQVVVAADGTRLRLISVPPREAEEARGTVVVMNGRAEFFERYYETMRDLTARGFHVIGFDWRGQGGSARLVKDRDRGFIRSFRQYDRDLAAVMQHVVSQNCPEPRIALAHSTGGQILLRNLGKAKLFDRAVVTAPLIDLRYGKWPKWLAYLLSSAAIAVGLGSAYLPGVKRQPFLLTPLEENPLTSDAKRWARDRRLLEEHRELGVGGATYGWLNAAMRSFRSLERRALRNGLGCPVLVVMAGREKVVDNRATQRFLQRVPGVSRVTINTSLHEILMENDSVRAEFFAAFDSFTNAD